MILDSGPLLSLTTKSSASRPRATHRTVSKGETYNHGVESGEALEPQDCFLLGTDCAGLPRVRRQGPGVEANRRGISDEPSGRMQVGTFPFECGFRAHRVVRG